MSPTIQIRAFGALTCGQAVTAFTLRSPAVEFDVITYGAIITSLRIPDRESQWGDVVLGYDALDPYLRDTAYLGAVVGRYANRIADARFTLDTVTYRLVRNDGQHHLHGGVRGFDKHTWTATSGSDQNAAWVRLTRRSEAGEEGYPGTLDAAVTYTLTGSLVTIDYSATTDATTVVNLTQHSYFNLSGRPQRPIVDHHLTIHADRYLPVESGLIPSGQFAPVRDTPFDFRDAVVLSSRLAAPTHAQIRRVGGFDHSWVLNVRDSRMTPAATLYHQDSGRVLRVSTTEPGLQFYDGHLLAMGSRGPALSGFSAFAGLCLETQHFPDSPNQPGFPATVLRPGTDYRSTTSWRFGCE